MCGVPPSYSLYSLYSPCLSRISFVVEFGSPRSFEFLVIRAMEADYAWIRVNATKDRKPSAIGTTENRGTLATLLVNIRVYYGVTSTPTHYVLTPWSYVFANLNGSGCSEEVSLEGQKKGWKLARNAPDKSDTSDGTGAQQKSLLSNEYPTFAGVAQWLEFQPSKHGVSFRRVPKLFESPYECWNLVVAGSSIKS